MRYRLSLITAVAALLAVLVAGCGSSGERSSSSFDLASAASATTNAKTAKVSMDMQITASQFGGKTVSMTGDGALDLAAKRGDFNLDMGDFAKSIGQDPSQFKIHEILDGTTIYMQFPLVTERLGAGTKWVKLDLQKSGQASGIDMSSLMSGNGFDPSSYLRQLKAASGSIERKGTETVRGTQTTRYHAVIDYDKVPDTLPAAQRDAARKSIARIKDLTGITEVPIDVWVDSQHRVRRLTLDIKGNGSGSAGDLKMSLTMDLYDFGIPVHVTAPPASETKDLSDVAGQSPGQGLSP